MRETVRKNKRQKTESILNIISRNERLCRNKKEKMGGKREPNKIRDKLEESRSTWERKRERHPYRERERKGVNDTG